jgi:hypothetical protein
MGAVLRRKSGGSKEMRELPSRNLVPSSSPHPYYLAQARGSRWVRQNLRPPAPIRIQYPCPAVNSSSDGGADPSPSYIASSHTDTIRLSVSALEVLSAACSEGSREFGGSMLVPVRRRKGSRFTRSPPNTLMSVQMKWCGSMR